MSIYLAWLQHKVTMNISNAMQIVMFEQERPECEVDFPWIRMVING